MPDAPRSWRLGFWSLIATQFQGAFNDNGLKFLILYLIIGTNLTPDEEETKVLLVGALFALPFILFSMTGGYLADRFSKRTVTIGTKLFEIGRDAIRDCWICLAQHAHVSGRAVSGEHAGRTLRTVEVWFAAGNICRKTDLSWGNGVIELGTFLAAIAGTVVAGQLKDWLGTRQEYSGIFFLACSARWPGDQSRHHQSRSRRSRKEIPAQLSGRPLDQRRAHCQGSRPVARRRRKHLLLLSRRVAAI